ncbi:MAG: hypothetical protein IT442_16680 [Phycisphaeraceae bacterium]|nr:hypothetical protein [Phycisphaeraceae bacterium]
MPSSKSSSSQSQVSSTTTAPVAGGATAVQLSGVANSHVQVSIEEHGINATSLQQILSDLGRGADESIKQIIDSERETRAAVADAVRSASGSTTDVQRILAAVAWPAAVAAGIYYLSKAA